MRFEPLPLHISLFIVTVVPLYLVCAELVKRFVYRRLSKNMH
jgi:hypothetical protein